MQVCDAMQARYLPLAIMYNLTGNEMYAKRARDEIIAACKFQDWHPWHFLDTGIMVSGLGLAYDWLYHWLSEEEKSFIRRAIVEKGISQIILDYDGVTRVGRDDGNPLNRSTLWHNYGGDNWHFVCSGGVATGALAICDELEGEALDMAERCMEEALLDIRSTLSLFAPDGGYEEGTGYWHFASQYFQRHLASLVTASGSSFGYLNAPGLKNTNRFMLAMAGPVAKYGYHDTKLKDSAITSSFMFWAVHFKQYGEAKYRIRDIMKGAGNYHDLLFYTPEILKAGKTVGNLDIMVPAVGVFTARSSWENDAFWIGFHADEAISGPGHDHMDGGSFSIQAMGEEFVFDLGSDDYNVPNYHKNAYRCRAEGHNSLLVNPGSGQYGEYDMQFGGFSRIDVYASGEDAAFAQADITDLFREDFLNARRGIMLCDKRRTVIVQDEIVTKVPSEIYWFAHTRAMITISRDGKIAKLTRNGKVLIAEIVCGKGAVFSVMDAKPLNTSPICEGQDANEGVCKLTIHLKNVTNLNLMVIFYASDSKVQKSFVPLKDWKI